MALTLVPACAAQRHALIQGHIITNFSGLADHDPHAMVDKEATPHLGTRMNLDPGQPPPKIGHQASEPFPAFPPQQPRQSVNPDRMHARVAGQDLECITRRRITMENALNIFTQTLEHH